MKKTRDQEEELQGQKAISPRGGEASEAACVRWLSATTLYSIFTSLENV